MRIRTAILCGYAALLAVFSLLFNLDRGASEGGGPCAGVGSLILILLLIVYGLDDLAKWNQKRTKSPRGFEVQLRSKSDQAQTYEPRDAERL